VSDPLDRGQVSRRVLHEQRGLDEVSRLATVEEPLLPHVKRHGHARHESGDVAMLDGDLLATRIDDEHLTLQLILTRT
jgi:hypothetical protein